MSNRQRTKTYHVMDGTMMERVVWDAEFDDVFFCYVTKISTDPESDLYSLNIESIQSAERYTRRMFTHRGTITPELIARWKEEIQDTVDQLYVDNRFQLNY